MVAEQIAARGVRDPRVLNAMATLPRHRFAPPRLLPLAYRDQALPIGAGQTLSQPYIVALMAEALDLHPGDKVLEVGAGSGYFAAVLAALAGKVFAIELEPELHRQTRERLASLGQTTIALRCGDGALGWPEEAPFDAIVLSCATPRIPPALWEQLAQNGRLLAPMGDPEAIQRLVLAQRSASGTSFRNLLPVAFVPLRLPQGVPGPRMDP
jgi:protein-L-isoaspartate(D-aspartate) O-methyltransferase